MIHSRLILLQLTFPFCLPTSLLLSLFYSQIHQLFEHPGQQLPLLTCQPAAAQRMLLVTPGWTNARCAPISKHLPAQSMHQLSLLLLPEVLALQPSRSSSMTGNLGVQDGKTSTALKLLSREADCTPTGRTGTKASCVLRWRSAVARCSLAGDAKQRQGHQQQRWLVRPVTNSTATLVVGQAGVSQGGHPAFVGTAGKECSGEAHRRGQEDGLDRVWNPGKQNSREFSSSSQCWNSPALGQKHAGTGTRGGNGRQDGVMSAEALRFRSSAPAIPWFATEQGRHHFSVSGKQL